MKSDIQIILSPESYCFWFQFCSHKGQEHDNSIKLKAYGNCCRDWTAASKTKLRVTKPQTTPQPCVGERERVNSYNAQLGSGATHSPTLATPAAGLTNKITSKQSR